MLRNTLGFVALLLSITAAAFGQSTGGPRVTALYTTWDDYYFYAAVQVHDGNVLGTNTSPTSQPQQDDDVELFFETDNAKASTRSVNTYQMAISAAGGSYFSVGTGAKIPKAKVVYTCKYAETVDGTLNDASDKDTGFTVELAIPWQELGLTGPPKEDTIWGFNVISRDRAAMGTPAGKLYSLSPSVTSRDDVQNPSKWAQLRFSSAGVTSSGSSNATVIAPHVSTRFPLINGRVASGEWSSVSQRSFGGTAIDAAAPTTDEEPNTGESPFVAPPPAAAIIPAQPTPAPTSKLQYPNSIALPGGGSIKIVIGGIPPPDAPSMTPKVDSSGDHVNPLTPKLPKGYRPSTAENSSYTGSLSLTPNKPPYLIMAVYRVDLNGDTRRVPSTARVTLADQPVNGVGPWESGLRSMWHRQQLTALRRSGIDVALVKPRADDTMLARELNALTQALKEMKRLKLDYPLIGFDLSETTAYTPEFLYAHLPAEFRATLPLEPAAKRGLLIFAGTQRGKLPTNLADGTPLALVDEHDKIAVISPGSILASPMIARQGGAAYQTAWDAAIQSNPNAVYIDSWNDYYAGSEVATSRQYGERYSDLTHIRSIDFNGDKEWRAKYLSENVPRTLLPKTLYTVTIRVENAGTLPWRAGEGYSLCARWYKDGRLFDDSAPRIPISVDLLPGRSANLGVGLVARNSYGENIEPGAYTLVFDIVQGEDKWFSYASDSPLQIPVTVLDSNAATTAAQQATFVAADTPTSGQSGATYHAHIQVRNDGPASWLPTFQALAWELRTSPGDGSESGGKVVASGETAIPAEIQPGELAVIDTPVALTDLSGKPVGVGDYEIRWTIKALADAPFVPGNYTEPFQVTDTDSGASFLLSDIPRNMSTNGEDSARLAVRNLGNAPWPKGATRIGYHWFYLDGAEAQWDGGVMTPLKADVPAGDLVADVVAKVRAPAQAGRYSLVWDVRLPNGEWASGAALPKGNDLLQAYVNVTGKSDLVPVDLTKYFNAGGIKPFGNAMGIPFDDIGHAFPIEFLPPDGTREVEGDALLFQKGISPLYPSGYYSPVPTGDAGGLNNAHRIHFLYPQKKADTMNLVACQGQEISVPGGKYRSVHLLAAATGGELVKTDLNLRYDGGDLSQSVSFEDWSREGISAHGVRAPFELTETGATPTPCWLGDYTIVTSSDKQLRSIVLPQAPGVKILAITLEK